MDQPQGQMHFFGPGSGLCWIFSYFLKTRILDTVHMQIVLMPLWKAWRSVRETHKKVWLLETKYIEMTGGSRLLHSTVTIQTNVIEIAIFIYKMYLFIYFFIFFPFNSTDCIMSNNFCSDHLTVGSTFCHNRAVSSLI